MTHPPSINPLPRLREGILFLMSYLIDKTAHQTNENAPKTESKYGLNDDIIRFVLQIYRK
jgi:hypothetical protein